MKAVVSNTVRELRRSPSGAQALRELVATGRLNEVRKVRVVDQRGNERELRLRLVAAQG
jgi:uncharacterized Ntn-hydrolase superfamily protein